MPDTIVHKHSKSVGVEETLLIGAYGEVSWLVCASVVPVLTRSPISRSCDINNIPRQTRIRTFRKRATSGLLTVYLLSHSGRESQPIAALSFAMMQARHCGAQLDDHQRRGENYKMQSMSCVNVIFALSFRILPPDLCCPHT